MAAGAWKVYNLAKKGLMNGTLDLDTGVWKVALFKGSSNAGTATLNLYSSVTNQVNNSNGYTTGGTSLLTVTWTTGDSTSEYRWDCVDPFFSCVTSDITSIQYAAIYQSASAGGGPLICYSTLSTAIFSVTPTNRLTLNISANGIFELN